MSDIVEIRDAGSSSESKRDQNEEFSVEKILGKRTTSGNVEYNIKWKGFGDEDNTWEFEEDLDFCKHMIKEFEDDLKQYGYKRPSSGTTAENTSSDASPEPSKERRKASSQIDNSEDDVSEEDVGSVDENAADLATDSQSGKMYERVTGMTETSGELLLFLKLKNKDDCDLVPAKKANVMCPELVIKFYEERLSWPTVISVNGVVQMREVSDDDLGQGLIGLLNFDYEVWATISESGRVLEKVIGATKIGGQLYHLLKWENIPECDLVPAERVNKKYPQISIAFYEQRISWIQNRI